LAWNGAGQYGLIHHAAMQQQKIQPRWEAVPEAGGFQACFCGKPAHAHPRPAMLGDHAPKRRDKG
jgi:hypothetical protein